jgi:HEPN domain-containing protein
MSERSIVDEWLLIAFDDYDSAKFLNDNKVPKPLEIICYHCQQSVEKSLKAFLCANDIKIEKIHETGTLCQNCIDLDSDFSDYLERCDALAAYATHTRYPVRIEIANTDADRALLVAKAVYDFVKQKIDSMFEELGASDNGL